MSYTPEQSKSVGLHLFESVKRYPIRWGAAVMSIFVVSHHIGSSSHASPAKAEAMAPIATTTTTATIYGEQQMDWQPDFTVQTKEGFIVELACRGTEQLKIKDGDTLKKIAAGVDSKQLSPDLPALSIESIIDVLTKANNIANKNLIIAGHELSLPVECAAMSING